MRRIILYNNNKPKNEIIIYDANINIWNKDILIKILSKIIITVGNITVLLHHKKYFYIEVNNNDHLITYKSIKAVLHQIFSIESKGFLNNSNLEKFPIISEYIKHLTKSPEYIRLEKSSDSYKWIFNIILLSLHEVIVKTIIENEKFIANTTTIAASNLKIDLEISDLMADFINLNKEILAKLDPAIRKKLQNRGITITQNIYAGFDTEFKRINENKNKLLSVQLAINTKTLLRIPKNERYTLSSIDVITGKEFKLGKNKKFYFKLIENTINQSVNSIRSLKCINDYFLANLIFELKMVNVKFIEQDDDVIFSFPRSALQPFIFYGENYSMEDVVNQITLIGDPFIKEELDKLFSILVKIYKHNENSDLNLNLNLIWSENKDVLSPIITYDKPNNNKANKSLTRSSMNTFTEDKISVTKIKNIYLIAHFSNADLCMLSDFDKFKESLDIVQKSYITLRKPIVVNGNNVIIRDTMLLSPQGKKSLDAIGKLYEGFDKIELTLNQKENMDLLLLENKELFQDYAVKDAVITLIHANYMEDFYFNLKGNAIPSTISKISAVFVLDFWRKNNYKGYQISHEFLLSNTSATVTPKGLWAISSETNVGFKINYYIANYKGGRNECFMFGVDKNTHWFDYDLASAYTTIMAFAGNPDYNNARKLNISELIKMSNEELIFSYTIIECEFAFKDNTKFPSIPCFIDKSSTAYPLKGTAVLTGLEYLLAKNQGCFITVKEAYTIPFETAKSEDKEKDNLKERVFINHPFLEVIKHCQNERRKHPKNSILNLIWKLLGNGIYGLTAQGLNEKMKFNVKTNSMVRMDAGELSNPIIASWTTAFIRCIIGESLHNIAELNGKVVSVTTDGFITDIENLENKLLSLKNKDITFFNMYRRFRNELSDNPAALELKNDGIGIISWTTRGQLSLNANIKATTGFQANNYNNNLTELNKFFTYILSTDHKRIEYIQKTLTTAKNLFLKGGHVTPVYRDQIFRLHFDNKRIIIVPIKLENNLDFSNVLLDSKPVKDIKNCANLRNISKILKTKTYQKHSNIQWGNTYKKFIDLAIRNFIKAVLASPPLFNLTPFQNYQEIINFIKEFDNSINISKQKISNLKNRKLIFKTVPKVQENVNFAKFIKNKFPNFNDKEFFN